MIAWGPLQKWALLYLVISLAQAAGRYGWRMYLVRASFQASKELRLAFSRKLMSLPASFFDRNRVGNLLSLSTTDTEAIRQAFGPGVIVLADALVFLCTVPVAMMFMNPTLTFWITIPLWFVPWLMWRNEREIHVRYEGSQQRYGELTAQVQEGIAGARLIKAYGAEPVLVDRIGAKSKEYVEDQLSLARVQSSFGPTLDFATSAGTLILLVVGGHDYLMGGATTLGTLIAFQRYIQKFSWPMTALGTAVGQFQRAVTSFDRLKKVFLEAEAQRVEPQPEAPISEVPGPWKMQGLIEFKSLSFSYPGTDRRVLEGVNWVIEPGMKIGVLGSVGSGKSTLLSLLPRLYDAPRGALFIDGKDILDWPLVELRAQVGFVSQEVFLFRDTISENIALGSIFENTTLEKLAERADLGGAIKRMSARFETPLGENGQGLSGGQRQRLTLARALGVQPRILILDDALSAVDGETESRILKSLVQAGSQHTEFRAAHRLSTLRGVDRILVLDRGRVRQMGTHSELMADRRSLYRFFVEEQERREAVEGFVGAAPTVGGAG